MKKRAYSLGIIFALLALLLVSAGFIPAQQKATITVSLTVTHRVTLTWVASTTTNVIDYRVYRGTTSTGPYQALTTANILVYVDTGVMPGVTYYYYVTAIDVNNNESVPSNQVAGTIPNP